MNEKMISFVVLLLNISSRFFLFYITSILKFMLYRAANTVVFLKSGKGAPTLLMYIGLTSMFGTKHKY